MAHKYIVVRNTYQNGEAGREAFGIAVAEEYDGITTVLESVSDISSDPESIERLVELCNVEKLDPIHLRDVVTDFLASV